MLASPIRMAPKGHIGSSGAGKAECRFYFCFSFSLRGNFMLNFSKNNIR